MPCDVLLLVLTVVACGMLGLTYAHKTRGPYRPVEFDPLKPPPFPPMDGSAGHKPPIQIEIVRAKRKKRKVKSHG